MNFRSRLPKLTILMIQKVFVIAILITIGFTPGYYFGVNNFRANYDDSLIVNISRENPPERGELDFSLFWRVWDMLDKQYFDKTKLDSSKMVYGAIRGMVAAVGDPYTVFLPPKENKVIQEDLQGEFGGVGIQIGFKGTQLAVIAPLPNSPAEQVGIQAGDLIAGIKDEEKGIDRGTVGITLPEAVQTIRGKKGSTVTLSLLRDETEELIVVDVVRDTIEVPSVILSFVGENEDIAHVQLLKFSGDTLDEWDEKVVELLTKPKLSGMILDVRNNPGGFLQGAVDLASDFLENGEVVVIEEDGNGNKQEFKVDRLGRFRSQKLVILVNKGSASASEILAGALRDQKKVPIVGQTTFGKGTIQESQQVNGEAGLHITFAKWLTPSGFWVNKGGIVPDIETENDPETEVDEQLEEAIRLLEKLK